MFAAENKKLIEKFYTAFQKLDAGAMADCYHADVRFYDPVFLHLNATEAGAMWRMLCSGAKRLEITFGDIQTNEQTGSAHWEARYDFSATGRPVHNKIEAEFEFKDGKIIKHKDAFDFWKWSSQALGPVGLLLGGTPIVRGKVQKQAAERLAKFINL